MHGGQHHGGGHHGGHHGGHSGAATPGHHSIIAQLLGIHNHHHILHAQSGNPHGLPMGVLPGIRLGLLLEGITLSPGFLFFVLFSGLIGYLFFIHWLSRHDPLAARVMQSHGQSMVNPLDSSIVKGTLDAYPIKTNPNGSYVYVPGTNLPSKFIVSPGFNFNSPNHPTAQNFGQEAFRFVKPTQNPLMIGNSISNEFNFKTNDHNSIYYRQNAKVLPNSARFKAIVSR